MKKTTKKARISKGLFYRPTLKLTTGLFQFASQYDSTTQFPDWKIGDKNRSVTLINAKANISLLLSNISIRYTKELIGEDSNKILTNIGDVDLDNVNKSFCEDFDIKVTKSIITEFQEVIELDIDYSQIVNLVRDSFLNDKGLTISENFQNFHNISYVADFKDKNGRLLSILLGAVNQIEVNDFYINHIVDNDNNRTANIGNNNLYIRITLQKTAQEGIKIDSPSSEFALFEEEIKSTRNKLLEIIDNAYKANNKPKNKR